MDYQINISIWLRMESNLLLEKLSELISGGMVKKETTMFKNNSQTYIHILITLTKDSLMLQEFQFFLDKFLEKSKWITNYNYKQTKTQMLITVSFSSDQTQYNHHGLAKVHLQPEMS